MKKTIFIVILMVFALSSVAIQGAAAQAFLGVKPGDNFTYSFEVLWTSADPNEVVPQEFSDMNRTISINVNVTDVATATAYVVVTNTMRDGSKVSAPGYIQVLSGRGPEAQLLIIQANLTAGDKAYPESTAAEVEAKVAAESFTIGETTTRTYLSTSRTVNHYSERVTNTTTGNYVNRDAYYDKETGILLEMTIEHFYADLEQTDSEHWKIIQFNSATSPPTDGTDDGTDGTDSTESFPWLLPAAIVVVVIVAVLATVILLRRRKARPETEAEPPPQKPA
jgi:hypothetical protein